jgi:hypothetical protein
MPVLAQGWLFGKPQPIAEFVKLRDKRQREAAKAEEDEPLLVGAAAK